MRKLSLHVLVAAMLLIGSGLPVAAQVDAIGILGYNTYSFDWGESIHGEEIEPFNSGFGGMALVRYWVTDSVAVAAGVDYLRGSGRDSASSSYWFDVDGDGLDEFVTETLTAEAALSSLGFLAVVAGRVSVGGNITLEPFLGVGSYGASLKTDLSATVTPGGPVDFPEVTFTADRQIGYLAGARVDVPVSPNINIGGTVGYRSVGEFTSGKVESGGLSEDFDDLSGFDVSGFFAGLTVSMAF